MSSGGPNFREKRTLTSTPGDFYQCCTSCVGPHSWKLCPRRSNDTRGRKSNRPRSQSTPSHYYLGGRGISPGGPLSVKQILEPPESKLFPAKRQFVAGKVDSRLISRRDFCGQQNMAAGGGRVERHVGECGRGGVRKGRGGGVGRWGRGGREPGSQWSTERSGVPTGEGERREGDGEMRIVSRHFTTPSVAVWTSGTKKTTPTREERGGEDCYTAASSMSQSDSTSDQSACSSHVTGDEEDEVMSPSLLLLRQHTLQDSVAVSFPSTWRMGTGEREWGARPE